jgi:hypothetical protein
MKSVYNLDKLWGERGSTRSRESRDGLVKGRVAFQTPSPQFSGP